MKFSGLFACKNDYSRFANINSIFIARAYTSIHSTRLISVLKRSCDASKAKTLVFVVNYQKKLGHKLYESKINATFHGTQIPFFVTVCEPFCIVSMLF